MIIFSYCEKSTFLGFQIWQNFIREFQVSQNFSMFRDFLDRASMRKGWETLFFLSSSFCMIIIIFLIYVFYFLIVHGYVLQELSICKYLVQFLIIIRVLDKMFGNIWFSISGYANQTPILSGHYDYSSHLHTCMYPYFESLTGRLVGLNTTHSLHCTSIIVCIRSNFLS